jgi:hypothetical protein
MAYQVATGHDNEAGFVTLSPQPKSQGIEYPRWVQAASALYPDGAPFVVWEFEQLTRAQYNTIILAFGLTHSPDDVESLVTIRSIGYDRSTWANWNGTVVHRRGPNQDTEFSMGIYRRATFTIKKLITT